VSQRQSSIQPPGAMEYILGRDRALVKVAIVVIVAIAWSYLVLLADDMASGDMRLMGMGAGHLPSDQTNFTGMTMGSMAWSPLTFFAMFIMWWVMMIGMMLPSAAPMVLLFALIQRKQLADQNPFLRTGIFAASYLALWGVFSVVATGAQWALSEAALLSSTMVATSQWLALALFVAGGVYQLTPLKHACLEHCRSPFTVLSANWKDGRSGAFEMGLRHGLYCIGCCWFLMALLFVGGVMNLVWVATIAILVLAEKVLPGGNLVAITSGLLMLVFAVFLGLVLTGLLQI